MDYFIIRSLERHKLVLNDLVCERDDGRYLSDFIILSETSSWDWREHEDIPLTKDIFSQEWCSALFPLYRYNRKRNYCTIRVTTHGNALLRCNETNICAYYPFSTRELKVTGWYDDVCLEISKTFNEIRSHIELPNKQIDSNYMYLCINPKLWTIFGPQTLWGRCLSCLLYTSPSPRDKRQSRMPSSA